MNLRTNLVRPLLVASSLVGSLLLPTTAEACGGFFCSASPVDQTAEHIIFTVNDDHTVTAYVQIQYAGDKDDFAWIIPAPGTPKLRADFPDAAMRALDLATEPQYFRNSCFFGVDAGAAGPVPGAAADGGVTVIAKQSVGPYDTVTLEGTSADVLVKWLNDNGYRINDKMTPLIQPYVEGGMHFVAMKLQADKAVNDITPLVMTYDSDKPMIPLRLTSVAAQPEMGIVTFILSSRRYAPENYIDLQIEDSMISFSGSNTNYLNVVSREADKVGGQAFVTEYAAPTSAIGGQFEGQFVNPDVPDQQLAKDQLVALTRKFPYITRLYTRMSAEEMTDDPIFMVSSDTKDVSNVHDLTDPQFDRSKCSERPPACELIYCGRRGSCVEVPLSSAPGAATVAACACANDATARITTTGGGADPYCEPVSQNLDGADAGALFVPACEGFSCGDHGACVPMNGNPTCQCEAGYAATVSTTYVSGARVTTMTCVKPSKPAPGLPVVPPVGQTTIPGSKGAGGASTGNPRGSGGRASTGSGGAPGGSDADAGVLSPSAANRPDDGCNVSRGASRTPGTAAMFAVLALGLLGRRRGSRAARLPEAK